MTSSDWTVKITGRPKAKVMLNILNRKQVLPNIRASVDQQYKNLLKQLCIIKPDFQGGQPIETAIRVLLVGAVALDAVGLQKWLKYVATTALSLHGVRAGTDQ